MLIRKASRKQAKLRLALCGVSGSGKTLGALKIAKGMKGKTIVIDTENTSADLYANVTDFDVITLQAPFAPSKYIEAIELCEKSGYDIIIIDSLSHAWDGSGGLLEKNHELTKASSSKNSYFAWREVTPLHNKLVEKILQTKAHIIVTMRSKAHYDIAEINGKKTPVKVGLAPVQRDGIDYEFTTVLDIDKDSHLYKSSKDRTQLFEGNHEELSEKTGEKLIGWLNDGKSEEQERTEILLLIKNKLSEHSSLEEIKESYKTFIADYPNLKDLITDLCVNRKAELNNIAA